MSGLVLVSGANGFVGRAVVERLLRDGVPVRAAIRSASAPLPAAAKVVNVGDLDGSTDWRGALHGVSAVVHCAARVHQLKDSSSDPHAAFRIVNRDATIALARQAAEGGVRRFVYVSSIKVNGESTPVRRPFRPDDIPRPSDAYGISKWEAEQGVKQVAAASGIEVVVVRPPLVYGPGVRGNFRSMMNWLARGVPLPFGAISNRRSLVSLENLSDLLAACARHPSAAGQTFLVSDGEDLSTTELLRRTARALGRPGRLIPVPTSLLNAAAALLGRRELGQRLLGSLQVDISATREVLGWQPPVRVNEALVSTAQHFLATRSK